MDPNFIILRNHNLFRKLSFQECRELNVVNRFINAKKNDFIYLNSLNNNRLYFLKKGYVKIGHYDEQGNEVITEIIQQGDIFGQLSLEVEESNGEFAQAIKKDASICSFTISDFQNILEKRPDLAISFTKIVGFKFKTLRNRFWDIISKSVKVRLIEFLLYLAAKSNSVNNDLVEIENFLTHADIAGLIGSSRQTVTTIINELSDCGLLHFDRQKIVIHSISKMKKLIV